MGHFLKERCTTSLGVDETVEDILLAEPDELAALDELVALDADSDRSMDERVERPFSVESSPPSKQNKTLLSSVSLSCLFPEKRMMIMSFLVR